MPIPFIVGAVAGAAALVGVAKGVEGVVEVSDAKERLNDINQRHNKNQEKLKIKERRTNEIMDSLGKLEVEILEGFGDFSDVIEKIQNRPDFENVKISDFDLPKYNRKKLKKVSLGAGVVLGGATGLTLGAFGGIAAGGATTTVVMTLGTASTGTAIASLSGAAATNATLAALGGGALAAGGGGMALGSLVLGGATLGVGLLVGGIIMNATGNKLSEEVDVAKDQMLKAEKQINKICIYFDEIGKYSIKYEESLRKVYKTYLEYFNYISYVVNKQKKIDWNDFTVEEKKATENTVLLVGLLYEMCKIKLVEKNEDDTDFDKINNLQIDDNIQKADYILLNLN